MATTGVEQHIFEGGPKRILALDGGGIKGLLSLQFLKRIEQILAARSTSPDEFRLCDYFDLVGGTSTGAVIAAGLAKGYTVGYLERMYQELGQSIFQPSWFRKGLFRAKFDVEPLRKVLDREFGDITLGDERLRTGLAIVTKRLDTGSPWIVHNNPRGRYYKHRPGGTAVPNKDYRLAQIVRASTAAPHYFDGEEISVAEGVTGAFVDGGVSPHNNPSLQLLLLATLDGYAYQWPTGADELLIVSIGTGRSMTRLDTRNVMGSVAAKHALVSLASIMDDCAELVELMMQWGSSSVTGREIDREVGDLRNDVLGGGLPLFSYLRYDSVFDRNWLRDLGLDYSVKTVTELAQMDNPDNMPRLLEIGERSASSLVDPAHFPPQFDIGRPTA